MADNKQGRYGTYPLAAYNYRVSIPKKDKEFLTIGFSEVSGLCIEYETVIYRDGFSFLNGSTLIPGKQKPILLVLKNGVMPYDEFFKDWIAIISDKHFKDSRKDVLIQLCGTDGTALITWTVRAAMPVKLSLAPLSASSKDVVIATLELVAANLQIVYAMKPQ